MNDDTTRLTMHLRSRMAGRTTALLTHLIMESEKPERIFLVPTMPRREQVTVLAIRMLERVLGPGETLHEISRSIAVKRCGNVVWELFILTPYQLTGHLQGRKTSNWDLIADHL